VFYAGLKKRFCHEPAQKKGDQKIALPISLSQLNYTDVKSN